MNFPPGSPSANTWHGLLRRRPHLGFRYVAEVGHEEREIVARGDERCLGGLLGRSFAFAGAHSIAIYLAFFLPMAAMRTMLVKLGIIADVGTMSAIVTVFATVTPLIALAVADRTFLKFLFNRPAWARLVPAGSPRKAQAPQAALTAAE